MIAILLAFRHETIGIDLSVYKNIFSYISNSSWSVGLSRSAEVGWSFLNKIIVILGGNFRWLIVASAMLSIFWVSKAYIKYSDDTSLTISLFIITSNFILLFSGLRQSIAVSLGFLAFEFVRRKKIIPFSIVLVIAILFHISAFMIIFMYPLYHIKFKKKWLIFVIPLLVIIFLFNQPIFTFLGLILNQFTDYDTSITQTNSVTMLILFIAFAVFAYIIPDESKLDADTVGMRNFLLFSVALQMFAPLHNLAMRMNYYYIIFIPLLIPKIIKFKSERWKQVADLSRYIMIIFFMVYFFINAPASNDLQTFPYRFLWESVS